MKQATNYNLSIPDDSYRQLKRIADEENTSLAELFRKATKLYLYLRSVKQNSDARFLIERGDVIQEIILDLM